MNLGKQVRLQRIFNRETGRAIIVPMDHGVSVGPIEGIENIHKTVSDMADGGADAVLMHKGLCRCCFRASGEGKDVGLIIHLSASTSLSSYSNKKRLVCTVEEAIRRGADGVSVHVNLGDDNESDMLADLGEVARVAEEWSMPLLAMLYARGPRISNEYDPAVVAHCARVGVELGADIVKVPYTGDIDSFADVIAGCCVPVVIAGGPAPRPPANSSKWWTTPSRRAVPAFPWAATCSSIPSACSSSVPCAAWSIRACPWTKRWPLWKASGSRGRAFPDGRSPRPQSGKRRFGRGVCAAEAALGKGKGKGSGEFRGRHFPVRT